MPRPITNLDRHSAARRSRRAFTLIELMIVVAIIGVLAAIAIPSFNKSVRRSRTSEAMIGLRKIFDGSVVYYDRDHTNATGDIVQPQFPVSVDYTPTAHPPRGVKADPVLVAWEDATWQALDFAVSDPYYYVYRYESQGITFSAQFRGTASADLDGDGQVSYFIRGGEALQNGVRGFPGVARINALE